MTGFSHYDATLPTILTVPGLGGSGPSLGRPCGRRRGPTPSASNSACGIRRTATLGDDEARPGDRPREAPVILAAHSLGCLAVAWWAELSPQPYGWPVAGALLVAPADVDRPNAPDELRGFAPTEDALALPVDRPSRRVTIPGSPSTARTASRRNGAVISSTRAPGPSQRRERGRLVARRTGTARPRDRRGTDGHGHARSPGDARSILAINATDAAQDALSRPIAIPRRAQTDFTIRTRLSMTRPSCISSE